MIDIYHCINCFVPEHQRHLLALLDQDTLRHSNTVYYATFKHNSNLAYLSNHITRQHLHQLFQQPWMPIQTLAMTIAGICTRQHLDDMFTRAFAFIDSDVEVRSLFNVAVTVNNQTVFNQLVHHPAIQTDELTQAFQLTCHNGNTDIARVLIQKEGTQLQYHNCIGLKWCSLYGHMPIIRMLLNKGLNPAVDDNTCMIWAAGKGHIAVVKFLLTFPQVDPAANNNEPLKQAQRNGKRDMVRFLLSQPKVQQCHRGYQMQIQDIY